MEPVPQLVAHRGWNRREPENTLPALVAALEAGARWLEVDVQLSADRVPVIFHDRTLERRTGRDGAVAGLPAAELAMLPTGPEGARRADATVPTLDAAVSLLARHPKARLLVELKRVSMEQFGREAMLDAALPALEAIRERVTLISYDAEVLRLAREQGWKALGWILETVDAFALAAAQALDVALLVANRLNFDHSHGVLPAGPWEWMIFAVDTAEEALAWGARGARYVETDDIGALLTHPAFAEPRA